MNAPCICPAVRYTLWHYINRCVNVGGERIHLNHTENELFFILYVNMGRDLSREDIIHALWGDREDGGPLWAEGYLRKVIHFLIRKTGLPIRGRYSLGLTMDEPETATAYPEAA